MKENMAGLLKTLAVFGVVGGMGVFGASQEARARQARLPRSPPLTGFGATRGLDPDIQDMINRAHAAGREGNIYQQSRLVVNAGEQAHRRGQEDALDQHILAVIRRLGPFASRSNLGALNFGAVRLKGLAWTSTLISMGRGKPKRAWRAVSHAVHGGVYSIEPFPGGGWSVVWRSARHEARIGNFSRLPDAQAAAETYDRS